MTGHEDDVHDRRPHSHDFELRLCGACGTELSHLETGSFCIDCNAIRRRRRGRR